jgi:hypothetical protein
MAKVLPCRIATTKESKEVIKCWMLRNIRIRRLCLVSWSATASPSAVAPCWIDPGDIGDPVTVVDCDRRFLLAFSKPSRKANAAFANTRLCLFRSGGGNAGFISKWVYCGSILYTAWNSAWGSVSVSMLDKAESSNTEYNVWVKYDAGSEISES